MNTLVLNKKVNSINIENIERLWDVVVVGAGLSGIIAAHKLKKSGLSVLLVDKEVFPRHKPCGCCLNELALKIISSEFGIGLKDYFNRIDTFKVYSRDKILTYPFKCGVVVDRKSLDLLLINQFKDIGGTFLDDCSVLNSTLENNHRVLSCQIEKSNFILKSKNIVLASGLGSGLVRKSTNEKYLKKKESKIGLTIHFKASSEQIELLQKNIIHMVVSRSDKNPNYVGLVLLDGGIVNLSMAITKSSISKNLEESVNRLLCDSPFNVPKKSEWLWHQGTPPLTQSLSSIGGEKLFIVGDAAKYVEPFTGEGMFWALKSGSIVSKHVLEACNNGWSNEILDRWILDYKKNLNFHQKLCSCIAYCLDKPRLSSAIFKVLSASPYIWKKFTSTAFGANK